MKIAEVKVSGTTCDVTRLVPISKGLVGATVSIEYTDSVWDGLTKTIVFRSSVTKDVVATGSEIVIPSEVVSRAGVNLYMGVYGVDATNNVVIPTIWAELGLVHGAAAPSGDTSIDPTLPVWAQIQGMIGNLDDLDTVAKSSLVAAVNEALTKGGGEIDPAEVQKIVEDYLKENPPSSSADISLGLTSATVGQTIKVKAVDADGKPTEWEAAETGEKWEKITEIIIPEGEEESSALTINKDINGQPFELLKAKLLAKFPKYTGESTIPNITFAMLNGITTGTLTSAFYTSLYPKPSKTQDGGNVWEIDVSGAFMVESRWRSFSNWGDPSRPYYGNSADAFNRIVTDSLWAKPITSIGGAGMLIYPGCKFVLYGVRA